MADKRPNVLIACDERVRHSYLPPEQLVRLDQFADWSWFACEGGGIYSVSEDSGVKDRLKVQLECVDGLVVCHGAPRIDAELMERAPRLKFIGELEGDRFAARIDLEAAWARSIRTVDTTNGSSYPVAEWALALTLIAMRNAGKLFRRLIAGDTSKDMAEIDRMGGVLTGKRVGLIGCGHMGRRLINLLRPFNGEIWVYDPYLPREMAEALDFLQTSLEKVLSECDAIVCLAPLTPQTEGMIGRREMDMISPGTALVNVSRGPIIDSAALIERLKRGDITAGLDVFDPEPIPPDSEILQLPNVFLTPHFSGRTGAEYPQFFQLMVDDLDRFFSGHETYYDLTPRSRANRQGEG
ncbi:MAG: hydroxyacid dehydrogenase [Candidatus Latescibacteria bacterium]|nr:hydroxyacid dehydrogenase [Candidatus Latescibacterota bacterium]